MRDGRGRDVRATRSPRLGAARDHDTASSASVLRAGAFQVHFPWDTNARVTRPRRARQTRDRCSLWRAVQLQLTACCVSIAFSCLLLGRLRGLHRLPLPPIPPPRCGESRWAGGGGGGDPRRPLSLSPWHRASAPIIPRPAELWCPPHATGAVPLGAASPSGVDEVAWGKGTAAAVSVGVLYQRVPPPLIGGLHRPRQPGGYADSAADIAVALGGRVQVVETPAARPEPAVWRPVHEGEVPRR